MKNDRIDKDLAFLLQFENVAWYEDGQVRILDRRIYPIKESFVTCTSYQQVAKAIQDMVTQSAGPYLAASMGMALAAYEGRHKGKWDYQSWMKQAAYDLSHARPTTSVRMEHIVNRSYKAFEKALEEGQNPVEALRQEALLEVSERYAKIKIMGRYLAEKVPQKGVIMTQCFAETILGMLILALREQKKEVAFFCPETRPYLQGARLTASVIAQMREKVTVITDNMTGYTLSSQKVDLFTSAADAITMDGYVVNKIGTFQIALLCKYYGIPYFVTGIPDRKHPLISDVVIEERNPKESLEFMGTKTTLPQVNGYYPAFDITPPGYCDGVVTDKGIFANRDLNRYYLE